MRALERMNPIAISVYFFSVALTVMLSADLYLTAIALAGSILCFMTVCLGRERTAPRHISIFVIFAVTAAANPLLSHNGNTVLLIINDMPITLEAVLYGALAAGGIAAVLYFFHSFSYIMTSDKLLYVLSALSPRAALAISMTLRYVPLMLKQRKKIIDAQRVLGCFSEDSLVSSFRANVSTVSALLTWSLENGVITADSMAARGHGIGHRSKISPYSFGVRDAVFIGVTCALTAICAVGISNGGFEFYPSLVAPSMTGLRRVGYASYAALVLLPTLLEAKEMLRWKYLVSKM